MNPFVALPAYRIIDPEAHALRCEVIARISLPICIYHYKQHL